MNKFTKIFDIKIPIMLAPMAGAAGSRLAVEVSNAGGLGLIAGGFDKNSSTLVQQLTEAKNLLNHNKSSNASTVLPVGIGLVSFHLNKHPEMLYDALKFFPKVVWFSFGDCREYVKYTRAASPLSKIVVQIQTLEEAIKVVNECDIDAIVCQGSESGGHGAIHNGSVMTLVPEVVDAVGEKTVVLAAGGIMDGRGLAASLTLGANGVVMGTRFISTPESLSNPKIKETLVRLKDGGSTTVRTDIFDKLGKVPWNNEIYNGRAIRNLTTSEDEGSHFTEEKLSSLRDRYQGAVQHGDYEYGVIYAGAGVGLIHNIIPAKDIVTETYSQALEILRKLSQTGSH
ncbi:hypothetical protein K7432_002591 [Basidiobolus ranarum]|uniref:Nitronate monooxygenase n=1 Tax=Basidiobolus ranarum TaxID=34480 RepID=A0ABR2X195_9FUNG